MRPGDHESQEFLAIKVRSVRGNVNKDLFRLIGEDETFWSIKRKKK